MRLTATERLRKQFEDSVPGHGGFGVKSAVVAPDTDVDQRLVKAWVSTTEVDQEGDVVVPAGVDTSYFPDRIKAVYLNHDYDKPVGVCRRLSVKDGGLFALTYIAKTPLGDETLTLVREGVIGGMSVGFRTMEAGPPTEAEKGTYGPDAERVVRKYRLVEYSLTAMPMNQGALIQKGLRNLVSRETLDALQLDDEPRRVVVPLSDPVVVRKPVVVA